MTTLAWDGVTLATDSRCCIGEMIYSDSTKKLYKDVGIFAAIALGGDIDAARDLMETLSGIKDLDFLPELTVPKGIDVLAIPKETLVPLDINNEGIYKIPSPWAYGSGQELAIAAMDHGDTAEQAVRYASTRDIYTNNKIQKYSIKEK